MSTAQNASKITKNNSQGVIFVTISCQRITFCIFWLTSLLLPSLQIHMVGATRTLEDVEAILHTALEQLGDVGLPSTPRLYAASRAEGQSEVHIYAQKITRRKFKGEHDRGNRTESLWEGNLPLRRSLRGRVFRDFSEVFRGFQRFSEVFRDFWEVFRDFERFSEVLSETLSEADFPLRGSQSGCPYSCCPLNSLQTTTTKTGMYAHLRWRFWHSRPEPLQTQHYPPTQDYSLRRIILKYLYLKNGTYHRPQKHYIHKK